MKRIVVFDEYDELDVKPPDLLHHYVELIEKDVARLLADGAKLGSVPCPGCRSSGVASDFSKSGVRYVECAECHTLYVSPRPDDGAIREYYRRSSAGIFWRNEVSRRTSKHRAAKIITPRFQWIADTVAEHLPGAEHFVDLNTNQPGYAHAIAGAPFRRKTLIDPLLEPSNVPEGVTVLDEPLQNVRLTDDVDAVSLFEVADRTADAERLFDKVHGMLKVGGLCFMTAILSTGFDLQVLWDKAPHLHAPDRLNVFSLEGLRTLFKRCRFECLEFSTPGIFDAASVAAALRRDPGLALPRFVRYLLMNRDDDVKSAFQEFLQSSLLSSYSRIVLRKT